MTLTAHNLSLCELRNSKKYCSQSPKTQFITRITQPKYQLYKITQNFT